MIQGWGRVWSDARCFRTKFLIFYHLIAKFSTLWSHFLASTVCTCIPIHWIWHNLEYNIISPSILSSSEGHCRYIPNSVTFGKKDKVWGLCKVHGFVKSLPCITHCKFFVFTCTFLSSLSQSGSLSASICFGNILSIVVYLEQKILLHFLSGIPVIPSLSIWKKIS